MTSLACTPLGGNWPRPLFQQTVSASSARAIRVPIQSFDSISNRSNTTSYMMLSVGSTLPSPPPSLWEKSDGNSVTFPSSGKYIIVGVPGAFTPPCSSQVPGYLSSYDGFTAKGVSDIYIVAVNDIFVVNAWKEKLGGEPKVHFLSDSTGAFVKSLGLDFDASGLLGNTRSKRFAAVIEDGKVKSLQVENEAPEITSTAADKVLASL